jgi:hypothetical protein
MSTRAKYLLQAALCKRLAGMATMAERKALWLDLAGRWLDLAAECPELETEHQPPSGGGAPSREIVRQFTNNRSDSINLP